MLRGSVNLPVTILLRGPETYGTWAGADRASPGEAQAQVLQDHQALILVAGQVAELGDRQAAADLP